MFPKNQKVIGSTKDHKTVINYTNGSHLVGHEDVLDILPYALKEIVTNNQKTIIQEIEFPYVVGKTSKVKTNSDDEIVYITRTNRKGPTRFVKNREKEDTNKVTIVMEQGKTKDIYILLTAYIGEKAPPEPRDNKKFDSLKHQKQACEFRDNNALVIEE